MVVDSSSECWLSGTLASFSTSIHLGAGGEQSGVKWVLRHMTYVQYISIMSWGEGGSRVV